MAVNAKFVADFESFYTAVQKAEVSLKSFETGASKVESQLNRVTNGLSGTKLIQDATIMAEAVDRVGGVSKLTEAELQRVSAQAKEAAAKLTAMGQDVPPKIQAIADATKGVGSRLGDLKGVLTSVAGAFGVAFSVGAVVQFGKSVFESAGKIHDLASQLGISTDAVQGFKSAAELAGSSLDAVGTALTKMNQHLSEGDKSTVKALEDAGLSFQQIRSMKPEDAFLAITDAIQQIPDPMQQSELAIKLFGKSAAELLPAIKEGFRGASDAAMKMSEDTINSLEAAGDAWQRLADRVTIVSGTMIATALDATSKVSSSFKDFVQFLDDSLKFGAGAAVAMAAGQEQAANAAKKNRDINLSLAPAIHKTAEELSAAEAAAKKAASAFNAMFNKFSGKDAADEMALLDAVFRRLAASGQLTELQIHNIVAEALKLSEQGAKVTPRLWDMVQATNALSPGLNQSALDFSKLGDKIDIVIPKMDVITKFLHDNPPVSGIKNLREEFSNLLVVTPETMLKGVQKQTIDTNKAIGDLAQAFAQLGQIADGALGTVVRAFGTLVASIDTAHKGTDAFKTGLKGFKDGDLLGGILSMTSGIVGMASAAIAAGKAIAGLFDRNKGRDLVVDFAETFGGFDQLHAKLLELGDEGERLWIALTQGVGRNNPKEAQAAIDAVTNALKKKADAVDASTISTEAEAQATIETAAAAAQALDEVNERLKVNVDAWADWSKAVTGFLQKLADEIRALPIPGPFGPTPAFAGGGTSLFQPPARGGGASDFSADVKVPLYLDSNQVAEGVVRVTKLRGLR